MTFRFFTSSLAFSFFMLVMFPACGSPGSGPTSDAARRFLDEVNGTMLKLGVEQGQAGWIAETYITDDSEAINARATHAYIDDLRKQKKQAPGSTRC